MGWTGHSQSGLHKPLTPPEGREGGCSPCTGRHSLADVLCCARVLLTQLPQLPVSQPSTTAAPKGSEHPLTPQHFAKALAAHSSTAGGHRARAMRAPPHQSACGHPAGHSTLLHTAALLQGQRDPDPSPRITQITQRLFHLPESLSTHTPSYIPTLPSPVREL